MSNSPGFRYQCGNCTTQMMVTKGGAGTLECCAEGGIKGQNQLGKRFSCASCGTEALCVKGGEGQIRCCGQAMQLQQPKVLPSAD